MTEQVSLSTVNLNLLVALDCLLRECNVTRAARRGGITQSAMSHNLATLRQQFNDPLLVRAPAGMEMTARARRIQPLLREILSDTRRLFFEAEHFDPKTARRSFSLVSGDYLAAWLAPPLTSLLAEEAPHIDLSFREDSPANYNHLLSQRSIDLAIGPVVNRGARIRTAPFITERFVCAVRTGHPLLEDPITLDLYVRLPHLLISPTGLGTSFVDAQLEKHSLSRRIQLRVSSFVAAPAIIARTDLVLTAPKRIVDGAAGPYGLTVFEPPIALPEIEMDLLWNERDENDPGQVYLRDAVARAALLADSPSQ